MSSTLSTAFLLASALLLCSCMAELPDYNAPKEIHTIQQNWPQEVRNRFYHTPQGSEIMPYAWFTALEQPQLSVNPFYKIPLFKETSFLGRFGFLASEQSPLNPDGLPIGFSKDETFIDPSTQESRTVVALTCAACHTGQIDVLNKQNQRVGLRIDGGSASINSALFEAELNKALMLTEKIPTRFNRFARRVLGSNYNAQKKAALKTKLKQHVRYSLNAEKTHKEKHIYPFDWGFGRADGFNVIANHIFAAQLSEHNWSAASAPVNFPPLWETSWFDYVQYNGSMPNPLVRNIIEVLGTKSPIVLTGDKANWFKSSVNVGNLVAIEQWLAGEAPYQGLQAPRWPEEHLGAINQEKAASGEKLYAELCSACHYASQDVLQRDAIAESPIYWTARNNLGQPLLKLVLTDLEVIGTDPKQALDFANRTINTGHLGLGTIPIGEALTFIGNQVATRYFTDNTINEEDQIKYTNGHLTTEPSRAPKAYRARPLSGIWATPPFLHNGSVPTLFHLLSPANERPSQFSTGSRLFDNKMVGYEYESMGSQLTFDTTLPGNSNLGHEFDDGAGAGKIGRKLTLSERWELLEYLKTL